MAETDRIEKKHKKVKAKEAAVQQKDEASISFYLHASLFLFFLTSYTFLLFLYENKYPLILNNEILPEVLFACFGLLIFSFLSLFVLSFWRFLARVFIAAVAGGAVAYILGLLYPFNIGNYFAHYFSFLPQNILMYAAENGNQIIAITTGIAFFIVLNIFKGGSMAFLSLPVLVALFMLLNTASKQTIPETVQTSAVSKNDEDKTENLIYLILADHAGYPTSVEAWQFLNSKSLNPVDLPFNPTFVPAFYQTNKFTFYPSAYLRYMDKYRNVGSVLNPSLKEIGNDLFNRDDAAYYVSSEDAQVYTTRNDLFKELKKRGYRLNVYQTYPFDFCKGDDAKNVDVCQTYPAPLGALYQTNMTTASRLMLLVGHWLYSTPFGKNTAHFIYDKLKNTVNLSNIPFLGNPLSASLSVGQPLVLSHLRKDVLAAKGKNAFFAHLNLPHYPYVYDQNCQLKQDPMSWRSFAPYTDKKEINGELKRWEDYNQQLFCTYGQINYLIKELETAGLMDKTTIVIHGDKGAGIQKEVFDDTELTRVDKAINRFKNNMITVFGIYKPQNKKAEVNKTSCDIGTLISSQLLGKSETTCQPPDLSMFTQEEQEKSFAWLSAPIPDNYFPTTGFEPLYNTWLEKGGQAYMALLDERLKQMKKTQQEASKISFVAPPAFSEKKPEQKDETPEPDTEKTTDFVPVPQEQLSDQPQDKTAEESDPATAEQPEKSDQTAKEPTADPEQTDKETDKEKEPEQTEPDQKKETLDFIADDFGELPQPIVLPEIDSTVEEKWKTTDIKEGQKTTLELVPEEVNAAEETKQEKSEQPASVALPEQPASESEHPVPLPSPAPTVAVLPLPELEPVDQAVLPAASTDQPKAELPPLEAVEVPELTPIADAEALPAPATPETVKQAPEKETESAAQNLTEIKPTNEEAEAEAKAKAEAEAKAKAEAEAKAKAEAEAKAKAETEEKAKAEAEAKAKAEAEAKAKAEAEAKAKAEAEAKAKAETEEKAKAEAEAKAKAETEEKAKAEAEAKAKAEAEAKAKAEAEAKAKAEAEAKAKAEAEAKAKAEAEAKAKAEAEAKAKAKAEAEAKAKAEAEEESLKKAPPPPANADQLDIIKETVTERVNADGDVETYIFIERKPNPNRFKKKPVTERVLQQNLQHLPAEESEKQQMPAPAAVPVQEDSSEELIREPAPAKQAAVPVQEDSSDGLIREPAPAKQAAAPVQEDSSDELIREPAPAKQVAAPVQEDSSDELIREPAPAKQVAVPVQEDSSDELIREPAPAASTIKTAPIERILED